MRYVDPNGNSAVASITLKQAAKIAVVRGAPKLALAATDGPSPLLDIVATLWLCYDVYDILKNYSLTATEENEGQNPLGESPANEPSPLPDEGANSEKENTDGLGQVLNGAKPGRETKGHTKQWEKPGNMDDANKDFDSLNPQDVKNIPGGRAGKLPDGRNINVRDHSSDGRPTLEVQNGKERIKVRYGEE